MTPATIIRERLELVKDIPLSVGGHDAPANPDEIPGAFCLLEKDSWVRGLHWTDRPDDYSRVISAFARRFQDVTDQDGRNQIDDWWFTNQQRILNTVNDGHDQERGYMAADFAVRIALPIWLENVAGAPAAAATLRSSPPIVDYSTSRSGRDLVNKIRGELKLADWWTWRNELREKVRAKVAEAVKDHVAAVAGVAGVAGVAAVAGAADAAAAADAVDVADVADAAAAAWDTYYNAIYRAVKDRLLEWFGERWEPATTPLKAAVLELLERMVALGEQKAA